MFIETIFHFQRYKKLAISLTTPTDTRWMSIYNCASNVYSNMSKLIAQLPNLEKREECLVLELATNENRQLYEEIHEIYSPLKECNLFFQVKKVIRTSSVKNSLEK